jgi:hypothetical protein
MKILPPCRDHEERIQSLERIMEGVVTTMVALVDALKDNNANIAGLQELQVFKDKQDPAYTPPQLDPDNYSYFR